MARDIKFLNLILDHTLKVVDKSDGSSKQFMLEQADRIRSEIFELQLAELAESQPETLTVKDHVFSRKVTEHHRNKSSKKKTAKKKAKKKLKR